jgi:hypothetical protein
MGNICQIRNIKDESLPDFLGMVMKELIKIQIFLIIIFMTFFITTYILAELSHDNESKNIHQGIRIDTSPAITFSIIFSLLISFTQIPFMILICQLIKKDKINFFYL